MSISFYFALSEEDQQWGLHLYNCGSLHKSPQALDSRLQHPKRYLFNWTQGRVLQEYQLIYLAEGQGFFEGQSSGKINLSSGSLLMIFPQEWHRYKATQRGDWHTYWVGFSGQFAEHLVNNLQFSRNRPLQHLGQHPMLFSCFDAMFILAKQQFSGYQQLLSGELMKLFGWLQVLQKQATISGAQVDGLMLSAKTLLIQQGAKQPITEVADTLGIGYSKFRKVFKAYTGISPGQFRLQHLVAQACDLLLHSALSIKEISYELGFETPQYFSRIFKEKTGYSPVGYRGMAQQKNPEENPRG